MSNHPPLRWSSSRHRQSLQTSSFFCAFLDSILESSPWSWRQFNSLAAAANQHLPAIVHQLERRELHESTWHNGSCHVNFVRTPLANHPPAAQPCWVLMQQRWDLDPWGAATLEKVTAPYISTHGTPHVQTKYLVGALFHESGESSQVFYDSQEMNTGVSVLWITQSFKKKKRKEKWGRAFPRCLENKRIRIFLSYVMTKIKTEPTKGGMRCGGRSTSTLPLYSCEICSALLLLLLLCKPLSRRTSGNRRWFRDIYFCVISFFFPLPP